MPAYSGIFVCTAARKPAISANNAALPSLLTAEKASTSSLGTCNVLQI